MPITRLRLHFTGSRSRDLRFGVLAGLLTWVLGGLLLTAGEQLGWPADQPFPGLCYCLFACSCALFAATVLWLSRKPYARVFLAAMVVTAALTPPLLGWALLVAWIHHHG
jgi:hypothetical protein